jgi:hypothetical protein
VLQKDVTVEASLLFGPVRAVRAEELWLLAALVALMSPQTPVMFVRLPAVLAGVPLPWK